MVQTLPVAVLRRWSLSLFSTAQRGGGWSYTINFCSAVYLSESSHHRLQPDSLVLYLQPFLAKGVLPLYLRWSGWNLHIIDNLWNALKDLCLALQSYNLILWPLCCIILPFLTNIHCLIKCTMTTLSPPVSVAINQSIMQSFITLCLMQHFGQCITEM